jgi:hypothetical protein
MPVPVTKKRAAEPAAPMTIVAKRKRVAEPDVEELEIDETYHITTSLHSKYSIFPLTLCAPLQKAYANTMRIQMRALEANIINKDTYMFSLISELRVRQSGPVGGTETTVHRDNIPSLSLANTALLETFVSTKKQYLGKPVFVEQKPEGEVAKPEFTRLHCVRRNEIGWGFDICGCLTFHLVFMDNAKLNEYDIFVQRRAVMVEEEV